jgi:proteasome lid subunit RPN8/RPN11
MFKISERQYYMIMKQVQGCYPQETGGVLGGRDDTILAVLPVWNKETNDPNQKYGITGEDIERGQLFLKKHGLEYYGIYHSHPKGYPYPSEQDLSIPQKHLFIVGLRDRFNPELTAFTIIDNQVVQEQIQVLNDAGFSVIDVYTGKPQLAANTTEVEMARLNTMINDYLQHRLSYPVDPPVWDASSFSTKA